MAVNFAKPLVVQSGGGAPKSATPPNFNGPKQIAMVVRQFASAIRRQKFRAEVFRQRHPVLPTCTHAASWSWCPAANALTQVPLMEPSSASDRRLGSSVSVYSLNWVTPLRVGACAQLFNTTNSLALTTCFLLTEQPRQPVFESGLNRSSRALLAWDPRDPASFAPLRFDCRHSAEQ